MSEGMQNFSSFRKAWTGEAKDMWEWTKLLGPVARGAMGEGEGRPHRLIIGRDDLASYFAEPGEQVEIQKVAGYAFVVIGGFRARFDDLLPAEPAT